MMPSINMMQLKLSTCISLHVVDIRQTRRIPGLVVRPILQLKEEVITANCLEFSAYLIINS